jgi:hypothetical protein
MSTFDPADWLDRFTSQAGWYALREGDLVFGWSVPSIEQAMATREVYREDQPDRREAIAVLVKERFLIAQAGWTTTPPVYAGGAEDYTETGQGGFARFLAVQ